MVCALCLHASSDKSPESGQAIWSAEEATRIFDSILWAMGVYFASPKQCVSDRLVQMQLEGGDALYSVLFMCISHALAQVLSVTLWSLPFYLKTHLTITADLQ